MKKWLALFILLTLLLACGAARAETGYDTWQVRAADITVSTYGEEILLEPELRMTLGLRQDNGEAFAEISLEKDGERMAALWLDEEEGGVGHYAFSTGLTQVVVDPAYYLHYILLMNLGYPQPTTQEALESMLRLPSLLPALRGALSAPDSVLALLGGVGLDADGFYRVQTRLGDLSVSLRLSLAPGEVVSGKPYDLSGLAEVPFDPSQGVFSAAGMPEAMTALGQVLVGDDSIARLVRAMKGPDYSDAPNPLVTITMESGEEIHLELYPAIAPITVANFVDLAESGFYDGVIFHRVISGFMIQGGDPEGTGMGGPGFTIKGEFAQNGVENSLKHTRGVISMARSRSYDSAGSQFFIMHADAPHLDGSYAAFGRVTDEESLAVVDAIAAAQTDANDRPLAEQRIRSITVDTQGYEFKPYRIGQ